MIHEAGIPAPNVDYSAAGMEARRFEKAERERGLRLKPADLSRRFREENVFPVLLASQLASLGYGHERGGRSA
jgi:hypothetical protein